MSLNNFSLFFMLTFFTNIKSFHLVFFNRLSIFGFLVIFLRLCMNWYSFGACVVVFGNT